MKMTTKRKTKSDRAREWLLREIKIGNYPRGSELPPERELAESAGVSYMTLRKAVGELIEAEILERNHGSGTYVRSEISEHKVQKQLGLLLPAWSSPEYLDSIMYFSEVCEKANWLLKIAYARNWEDRALLDLWHSCDAMVLNIIKPDVTMPAWFRDKLCSGIKPVISYGFDARKSFGLDSVLYVNDYRMDAPCDRLYALGHRRILLVEQLIHENGRMVSLHPSMEGFSECFHSKYPDVKYDRKTMALDIPNFEMPHSIFRRELVARRSLVSANTAIICPVSFYWAVMSGLRDIGLRVPEDISVVTFGDRQELSFYVPRPAVFYCSLHDHAVKSLEMIRWRSENPEAPPRLLQAAAGFSEGETLAPVRPGKLFAPERAPGNAARQDSCRKDQRRLAKPELI